MAIKVGDYIAPEVQSYLNDTYGSPFDPVHPSWGGGFGDDDMDMNLVTLPNMQVAMVDSNGIVVDILK